MGRAVNSNNEERLQHARRKREPNPKGEGGKVHSTAKTKAAFSKQE